MGSKDYDFWLDSDEHGEDFVFTWCENKQRKPAPQSYFDTFIKTRGYFSVDGRKFCFSTGKNSRAIEAKVFSKHNIFLDMGFAFLHPNDEYNPNIGAKIALTDVLSKLNLTRGERFQIWHRFFETVGQDIMSKNV